jgi:thiol-disulfide isomerase/thioredoxin
MSGEMQGDKLMLSYFNGNTANLVTATVANDGKTMKGVMSFQGVWNEPFTATKIEHQDWANRVQLKPSKKKFELAQIKKYEGKPLVVVFGATWCPGCNDMVPYLVTLEEKYRGKNIQFLTLAYDLSMEKPDLERELAKFRAKYKVPWEMVAMTTTPEHWKRDMPPEILNWDGFPITAFIKPDGTVHAIYGGWFSPAAGPENAKLKAQFEKWASELVSST